MFRGLRKIIVVALVALSAIVVAPTSSADPPCSPGPNCYSIARDAGTALLTGGSAAIPRNAMTIGNSGPGYANHINSELWLGLSGTSDYMEAGLRNGYDAVNNAIGACGCVAYNQFWAEHKNGVQTTHVIAHTSPTGSVDLYEVVRGYSNGRWTVYLNHSDVGTSVPLSSWNGDLFDQGGEFQNTSCASSYGTASTFNMNAALRNASYAWVPPTWDQFIMNPACSFNGNFDGTAGHWSWNKN